MSPKPKRYREGQEYRLDNERPELSLSIIEALKAQGLTQSAIAGLFGVTRQAISYWVRTYNGKRTPRQAVLEDHYPFKVPTEMSAAPQNRLLRDHGSLWAAGKKSLSKEQLARLRSFYAKLRDENLVVEFDPDIPPEPGVAGTGGWAYRDRKPSDEDYLIRINEYTNITEDGETIWRFLDEEP